MIKKWNFISILNNFQINIKLWKNIGAQIVEVLVGGNLFVKNFSEYLKKLGHEVVYDLKDKDIDAILLQTQEANDSSSYSTILISKKCATWT